MPRKGKPSPKVTRQQRFVEKPQVPLPEIIKHCSTKLGMKKEDIQDVLNTYFDYCFDCIVDNREVFMPGIGRFWISDPKPYVYWDEREGKLQHTLTYPILRFRPVERLKDSLQGEVFREMKRAYKAQIEAAEIAQTDKEFDKHFKTKPAKADNPTK
jgi:nucleoid DNA-binding protein